MQCGGHPYSIFKEYEKLISLNLKEQDNEVIERRCFDQKVGVGSSDSFQNG